VLEFPDDERRGRGGVEEDAGLSTLHLALEVHPTVGRDLGLGGVPGAVVELPAVDAVERRHILDCVRVEGRAVGPQVDALVLRVREHAEQDAGVSARAAPHRHVHLDDAVLEHRVPEQGRAGERLPAEMLDHARSREVPAVGGEGDGLRLDARRQRERRRHERETPDAASECHWLVSVYH
jgi:hypothetical protein